MIDPIQAEIDALLQEGGQSLGDLMQGAQGHPIELINGADGQISGAKIGNTTVIFERGPNARIARLRVGNGPISRQQIEMPAAGPQPTPQISLPPPLNGF